MLIVEDGTGREDANSYASVEDADAYFALRMNAKWASLSQQQKESALVQATDYIDACFGNSFKGFAKTATQSLCWPRVLGPNFIQMPPALKKATFEYAVRASDGSLMPDPQYDETGQLILKKLEEVGPIKEETTYHALGTYSSSGRRPIPAADAYLKFLLKTGGGVIRA